MSAVTKAEAAITGFAATVFSLCAGGTRATPIAFSRIAGRALGEIEAIESPPAWLSGGAAKVRALLADLAGGGDRVRIELALLVEAGRMQFILAEDGRLACAKVPA